MQEWETNSQTHMLWLVLTYQQKYKQQTYSNSKKQIWYSAGHIRKTYFK